MHRDTKQAYQDFLKNLAIKPHDCQSEYKLVHALMCGKSSQISDIVGTMEADDFYDLACMTIFNTVKEDFLAGEQHDGYEQYQHLATKYLDRLNSIKLNPSYAGNLMEFFDIQTAPGDEEIKLLMKAVKDKHTFRKMVNNLYVAVDMCNHEDGGVEKAYEFIKAMSMEHDAQQEDSGMISPLDFSETMMNTVYEYNDPAKRNGRTINMPWRYFQKAVGGFGIGELDIISARPGQGKSAFAINIAIEAGVTQKVPTLYINSEMSADDLSRRYLSYTCYLDSRKIREGQYYDESSSSKLNKKVEDAILKVTNDSYKSKLLFATIPDLQLSNIERIIRLDCQKRNTKLVIVDYIGRMDITKVGGVKDLQEWQVMRLAASRLKTLAQKYNICVIMVAQLTDEGTLQGSRAMKNEADMWLSINRLRENDDVYQGKRLNDIFPYNTFVNIEKARNVSDDSYVTFRYEGAMMRFCDSLTAIKDMVDRNRAYGEKYCNELMSPEDYNALKTKIAFNMK